MTATLKTTIIQEPSSTTPNIQLGTAGQVGLGGANYGTSGMTILSAGPSAAPAWGRLEGALYPPVLLDTQTFNSSGTWSKSGITGTPVFVLVEAWGAGGSGGRSNGTTDAAGGGGGGGFMEAWFAYKDLGATESVTVGTGGVSRTSGLTSGAAGGNSTFSTLTAPGGAGGGTAGTSASGGAGGNPSDIAVSNDRQYYMSIRFDPVTLGFDLVPVLSSSTTQTTLKEQGGSGGNASRGLSGSASSGGSVTYGGGGGGGVGYNTEAPANYVTGLGGTSTNGGAGGRANSTTAGVAGSAPGGGGGASATAATGAGGNGRVIVYTYGYA